MFHPLFSLSLQKLLNPNSVSLSYLKRKWVSVIWLLSCVMRLEIKVFGEDRRGGLNVESENMWALSSLSELMVVETMSFSHSTSLSSHPLFSSIITLCFIIFIFCPQLLPVIIFSPVIIITSILLISLLRLGATQRNLTQKSCNSENNGNHSEKGTASPEEDEELTDIQPVTSYVPDLGYDRNPSFEERFAEWNVRAPLDVIYEEYEGDEEEEEEEDGPKSKDSKTEMHHPNGGTERHPSFSMYYSESDSDSSTDGEYATTGGRDEEEEEEEEEERDDLIEISLVWDRREPELEAEEENWIEIDISPTRNGSDAVEQ